MANDVSIKDFYKGDTKVYELTITDNEGTPVDITGFIITFTMKKRETEADPGQLQKTGVVTDASGGKAVITLPSAETKLLAVSQYYYDIQVITLTGNVSTLISDRVKVLQDITQTTT